jgi:Protein of unknown function (DUF3137)
MTDGLPEIDPIVKRAMEGLPSDFAGFDRVFENEIRPALLAREGDRIAAVAKARQGRWVGGGVGIAIAVVGGLLFKSPMALVAGAGIGFAYATWASTDLQRLTREAKGLIVNPIAQRFGLDFTIDPEPPTSIQRHRELGVVPSWDRDSYEDLVTGKRGEVTFELFEAKLEEKHTSTDSNGRRQTTWETVFEGQCLRFEFPKRFYGRTLVTRDAGFFNRFGGGGGLQRAMLEDPEFERIFEVYTSDQVESRYLLTPDLMQKLVDMEQAFHGGKLKCCFDGGELFITIQGGNLFEPGSLFLPLDNPERIRELLNDFAAVFNIIDAVTSGRRREEAARGA